ncbi:hypothetical protein [Burkholderia latens]|uniref:hypothetical protein n=1 Tax=Burkholderia latens TaxID=488446 RepID=UPI00158C4790|nr:hypothetical protein [Burkholderia latens]
MKPYKRIAALTTVLRRRSAAMRTQMAQDRRAMDELERQLKTRAESIATLKEELAAKLTPTGALRRDVLMRMRGRQAVGRYKIACLKLEIAEFESQLRQMEQAFATIKREMVTLERRQNTHEAWVRRVRREDALRQENHTEAEMMERAGYEFNR